MSYRVEPLGEAHDIESFTSGVHALDVWLWRHARTATGQGTRTYLLVDEDSFEVAGYFALAPHLIERDATPRSVGRGAPRQIPAILLAKLALHQRLHGRGLGAELLVRALRTIVTAARSAGGRVIVVDATSDAAASFYRAHDFQPSPLDANRLVMKLSTAAQALGMSWP